MDYGFGGAGANNDDFVDDGENPNLSQDDQFAPALGGAVTGGNMRSSSTNGNTANIPRSSPTNFIAANNTPIASTANAAATTSQQLAQLQMAQQHMMSQLAVMSITPTPQQFVAPVITTSTLLHATMP